MRSLIRFVYSIFAGSLLFMFVGSAMSYEATDADYAILDKVEDNLFDLMDRSPAFTPDRLVSMIEDILEGKDLTDRSETLLNILMDDIIFFTTEVEEGDSYEGDEGPQEGYYMLPEDCYDDEFYSEEDERCYPKESSDSDTADEGYDEEDDDQYYYGDDEYDADEWYDDEYDGAGHDDEEEAPVEASYVIEENDTISLESGEIHAQHQEVWKLFSDLIPASFRENLDMVHFSRAPDSDTFAHVNQIATDINNWEMTVNLGAFYPDGETMDLQESVHTLIHEYAHVLTLAKEQIVYSPMDVSEEVLQSRYADKCKTHFITEGCLMSKSYLNGFIGSFWSEKDLKAVWEEEGEVYKEGSFVSDYASSNPGEDIAESFTSFILKDKPQGESIADQKTQFFYQFPELVKLRMLIRTRLPQSV